MNIKNRLFSILFIALFSNSLTICELPYGRNKLALEKTILTALTIPHKVLEQKESAKLYAICGIGAYLGVFASFIMLFVGMDMVEALPLIEISKEINPVWWLVPIAGGMIGGSMALEQVKKNKLESVNN